MTESIRCVFSIVLLAFKSQLLTTTDVQEAKEKRLDLSAHDAGDIERLITCYYTLHCGFDDVSDSAATVLQVLKDMSLYILAD